MWLLSIRANSGPVDRFSFVLVTTSTPIPLIIHVSSTAPLHNPVSEQNSLASCECISTYARKKNNQYENEREGSYFLFPRAK